MICGILGGCSLREPYEAPVMSLGSEWSFAQEDPFDTFSQTVVSSKEASFDDVFEPKKVSWWTSFKDETLNGLVAKALKDNYAAQIAVARIEKAAGVLEAIHGSGWPQVEGQVNLDRSSLSAYNPMASDRFKMVSLFDSTVGVGWELDLFGKIKNEERGALADLESQRWAKNALDLILVADVCVCYFKIRSLQLEKKLKEALVKDQEREVLLLHSQYDGGLIDKTTLLNGQMMGETYKKQFYGTIQELQNLMTVLSVLTTVSLEDLKNSLEEPPLKFLPQEVPLVSLEPPVRVIRQRPDVQEAERRVAAAYAVTASAMAAFYPSLSLSGLFGYIDSSRSVGQLSYGGGVGALIPLLNFGVLEGQLIQAKAQEKADLLHFQEVVLKAFMEVESTMTKVLESKAQVQLSRNRLNDQEMIFMLQEEKVRAGLDSDITLVRNQKTLTEEKIAFLKVQVSLLEAYVQAMKALGGMDLKAP